MVDYLYAFGLWLGQTGIADLIGVIGFILTLAGLAATFRAAKSAESAANKAIEEVNKIEGFLDLSNAISALEAIKTLHRENAWPILHDRYANARKLLIAYRSRADGLPAGSIDTLTSVITNMSTLERQLETGGGPPQKFNIGKVNTKLSSDIDLLTEILYATKSIGGENER